MKRSKRLSLVTLLVSIFGLMMLFTGFSVAGMDPVFGGKEDVEYSKKLWDSLTRAHLAGPDAIRSMPYLGDSPHGMVLEGLASTLMVNGHRGEVHVKANYAGPDITRSKVVNQPEKYLKAVTVMFKRESGYDSENQDWFWAKYKADGTLHENETKMALAGRVAKGMDQGCIACHVTADGGDYLFNNTAAYLDEDE